MILPKKSNVLLVTISVNGDANSLARTAGSISFVRESGGFARPGKGANTRKPSHTAKRRFPNLACCG
jgi:hypothetical protein